MTPGWKIKDGETPYDDIDGFRFLKKYPRPTRQLIDELEEENVRKATLKYLAARPSRQKAPFDYGWLLKLHKEMYGDVWGWAGKLRTQNTQIGVDKHRVGEKMRILVSEIPHMPEHFAPVEAAARIHHQAVYIHPFKNGNGRWSRLLANIWLKQNDYPVTMWPSITGESPVREEYLQAVRAADDMDYALLIEMHRKYAK